MVDVESGLRYPLRGDGSLKRHAIGGGVPVLVNILAAGVGIVGILVPFAWLLFVPLVPIQLAIGVVWTGYFLRVARDTLEGGAEPPAFDDWGGLARDGFWGSLVVLAYQLPGIVLTVGGSLLAFAVVYWGSFGFERGGEMAVTTAGVIGVLILLVVFLVGMVYGVLATYLLPISLVAYADEGNLGAAFALDTLRTVGRSAEYAKPWAAAVGVYVLVATVVTFLSALLVGYVLVPFLPLVYFYVGTAAFYMFAQSYAGTTGTAIPATGRVEEPVGSGPAGGVGERTPDDV